MLSTVCSGVFHHQRHPKSVWVVLLVDLAMLVCVRMGRSGVVVLVLRNGPSV